jgi:D-alanyl-D-alanine carboxypeptidase
MKPRWISSLALCCWLAVVSMLAIAADRTVAEVRAEGLVAVLSQPIEARKAFVSANFTDEAIARRGLDGLAAFLAQVRKDIGDTPPLSVTARGDSIVYRIPADDGGVLRFIVRVDPADDAKITGFSLQPDDEEEAPAPVVAVAEAELPKAIAEAMALRGAKGFSGAVLVARDGAPLFAGAYGFADREAKRANTLDTPFNLGSMNKMFTALVIARLVEQGKLDWNDTVGEHLPDWPQAEVRDTVTLAHLLSHQSGLGAFWGPDFEAKRAQLAGVADYAALFHADKPAFVPGTHFKYSNNGFVLLGLVAEKVSGKDYHALVQELVFAPAGMSRTAHYRRDDEASGRAIGYTRTQAPNTDLLAQRGSPAGGGYSTARDLLRFGEALRAGRIVRPDTLATMTRRVATMGGDAGYGFGFGVFGGREPRFGHNGGSPGVNASFEVFPASGYTVIVLSNADRGAEPTAQQLGRMILARKSGAGESSAPAAAPATAPATATPSAGTRAAGG